MVVTSNDGTIAGLISVRKLRLVIVLTILLTVAFLFPILTTHDKLTNETLTETLSVPLLAILPRIASLEYPLQEKEPFTSPASFPPSTPDSSPAAIGYSPPQDEANVPQEKEPSASPASSPPLILNSSPAAIEYSPPQDEANVPQENQKKTLWTEEVPPKWAIESNRYIDDSEAARNRPNLTKSCNLYQGRWVWDPVNYPLWNPNSGLVGTTFQCQLMGRQDIEYLKLRWQPEDCNIPRFNPHYFLSRMQNRRIAFIGDCFAKSQFDSLAGILSMATTWDKIRQGGKELYADRRRVFMAFIFEEFNVSLEFYVSRNLVNEIMKPVNQPPEVKSLLEVDKISPSFDKLLPGLDIAVFNAGHWYHNHSLMGRGCYPSINGIADTSMSYEDIFRQGITTWAHWLESQDAPNTRVFFRSYEPSHGARLMPCPSTEPSWVETLPKNTPHNAIVKEVLGAMKDPPMLLDITDLSHKRNDGHVGWLSNNGKKDCSHWCTPGVPDIWNDLMYAELLRKGLPPFDQQP